MAKITHIQGQTSPTVVNGIFGDLELRRHFCQFFLWTSVITLAMEPVYPDGQNDPFSRSNDPDYDVHFVEIFHGRPLRP
ncbi:hypothetical protein H5410_031961 [Solanum commersonii]|uniref:Uncharacterized protein n=1 Tax=Solanum commersonii TaxID=4109 RepID=A0A9J5YLH7_SOLCO|nr:hypothetical protein H5410_031961 [Solanum commersonii]